MSFFTISCSRRLPMSMQRCDSEKHFEIEFESFLNVWARGKKLVPCSGMPETNNDGQFWSKELRCHGNFLVPPVGQVHATVGFHGTSWKQILKYFWLCGRATQTIAQCSRRDWIAPVVRILVPVGFKLNMCRQLNRLFVDPYSTTEALYRRPQQWCAWRKVLIRVNPRPTCKSGCRLVWFMLDVQRSNRTCVKRYRIEQPGASQRSMFWPATVVNLCRAVGVVLCFLTPLFGKKKARSGYSMELT